jgi:hypothetical protein
VHIPLGHVLPHAPQFAGSSVVSTQTSPHIIVPPVQLNSQAPAVHTLFAGHT